MKKEYYFFFLFVCSFATVFSQIHGRQQEAFDAIYNNTNGNNWIYKTLNELTNRTEAPYIELSRRSTGGDSDFPNGGRFFSIFNLSNNNLNGFISKSVIYNASYSNPNLWRFTTGANSIIKLSHNKLTEIDDLLGIGRNATALEFWVDNNQLTSFDKDFSQLSVNYKGFKKFIVHQNDITDFKPGSIGVNSVGVLRKTGAELFRIDNNRLDFENLIYVINKARDLIKYKNFREPGSPDCEFDYLPQKPLGGDYTEEKLSEGTSKTVSFSLSHAANVYSWQLNGKDVPLSSTKDYTFSVNEQTAGVWRCKITNPNLPEAVLHSYDMAVFMEKAGNKLVTDINFNQETLISNFPEDAIVGTFNATDEDGDEIYFRLPDKTLDNSHFRIKNGNTLVSAETIFDREYIEDYKIKVIAYDIYGGTFEKEITITKDVSGTNDLPKDIKLTNNKIEENLIDEVGKVQLEGVDIANYDLILPAELDNVYFEIQGNKLLTKVPLNFEVKEEHLVRLIVKSKNTQVSLTKDFIVRVININDAPSSLLLSTNKITINKAPGTQIGTFFATDDDPADTDFTYELTSDDFTIENGNQLQSKRTFVSSDIGTKSITVTVNDPHGASREFTLEVVIEDEPLPAGAKIVLDNTTVLENSTGLVGKLSVDQDPTGAFTYELVPGFGAEDNNKFTIIGNELRLNSSVNFEAQGVLTIRIKNDATPVIEHSLTINVENVNEAPTDIAITSYSLALNTVANTNIAKLLILDEDSDKGIFTIKSDLDAEYFTLNNDVLRTAKTLDKNEYSINVIGNDGQFTVEKELQIFAKGSNAPNNTEPTSIGINNIILASSFTAGVTVTELFMKDADKDNATFTVDGGTDAEFFEADGQYLKLKKDLDSNHAARYEVTVKATDETGNSISQDLEFYIHSDALLGNTDLASLQDDLVYPNPVQNTLNIQLNNNLIETYNLTIINIAGQVVYTEDFNKTTTNFEKQINIGSYARGVYFLHLKSASSLKKVVKLLKE